MTGLGKASENGDHRKGFLNFDAGFREIFHGSRLNRIELPNDQ